MNCKKKVTYILHDIAVGGVEVALISAIPALNEKYELNVIVLGTINPRMIAHLTEQEKEVFTEFNYPLYLYPFVLTKIVRRTLKNKPSHIICSLWRASLVGTIVRFVDPGVKLFSFNHNTRFPHSLAAFAIKLASRNADVVLTDSIATKNFVQESFKPNAEIRVISFLTHPTPESVDVPAPDLNHEVRFLFLGRINKVKNLPLAIKVIQSLRTRHVQAILDIYGRNDDDSAGELNALIKDLNLENHIRFKGEIANDQKRELFKRYHFYIQLSLFEGMAMSVAEAMQNGLVCVVSPVGEIVNYSKDMQSAIFIDIFKQDDWESKIEKVYQIIKDNTLYTQISQNCHQHFRNKKLYADSLIEEIES